MNDRTSSVAGKSCRPLLAAALIAASLATTSSQAALASYSEDFESMNLFNPAALGTTGWIVYGNVFSPDHSAYYYGYGTYPAPNGTPAFCSVSSAQGGLEQGSQGLVVYSDYDNTGAQGAGQQVEANVFQERLLTAGDAGDYVFRFDAKAGDLVSPSNALAFVKVINPATGYSVTLSSTVDTSALPATWATYSIPVTLTAGMAGQLLQFGFAATASNYKASGVYYDNVRLIPPAPPASPEISGVTKSGSTVTVTFPTETGATYDLFKSVDLVTFTLVTTQPVIIGDGTTQAATDTAATEPSAFYRIRRQQ